MASLKMTRGVGEYVKNEAHTCLFGPTYEPDGTRRPAIVFTGGPGDDRDFLTSIASGSTIYPTLARAGIPMLSAEFGGPAQWGNDTSKRRIGQAWRRATSQLGTRADKFVGIGVSKGYVALDNYARENPTSVAALVGIVPAANVSDIYDNNRSGLRPRISAAYNGDWPGAAATHDPSRNIVVRAGLGIPTLLIAGERDETVLPETVADYGAAIGAAVKTKTGADHMTTAPAVEPLEDLLAFLLPYLA